MNENLKKFLEAVSRDRERIERLKAMTEEAEIIAFAAELGFELTAADFGLPEGELDEKELAAVAGGGECVCVVGGGGTRSEVEEVCACVLYGQGGTELDNCRCQCLGLGGGDIDLDLPG